MMITTVAGSAMWPQVSLLSTTEGLLERNANPNHDEDSKPQWQKRVITNSEKPTLMMVSAQTTKKKEEKCDHWGILVTHFYRDKMTDFVSWNISRNALDTLYGQKVFLLYDLVAQGTFAVISHFFSLTSFSFFFLPMVFDTILFLTT